VDPLARLSSVDLRGASYSRELVAYLGEVLPASSVEVVVPCAWLVVGAVRRLS